MNNVNNWKSFIFCRCEASFRLLRFSFHTQPKQQQLQRLTCEEDEEEI